jgi:DNA-binding CsgD family transcriptional regulator
MTDIAQQPAAVAECVEQAQGLVRAVQEVLGVEALYKDFPDTDIHAADGALSIAQTALEKYLELAVLSPENRSYYDAAALMLRLQLTRLWVKDTILAGRTEKVRGAQQAVNRLRRTVSTALLAERAPVEASRMGFNRALFSWIRQGIWFACSAFADDDDEEFAQTLVSVGLANPRRLNGPLLESEMARRGVPILVRDAQSNPRVHREMITVAKTKTYVAAPVLSWGRPIGLVHADREADDSGVEPFDRDLLGTFAEGLGVAFERNAMVDRLNAMRRAADEHLRSAHSLADDFTLEVMDLAGAAARPVDGLLVDQLQPQPTTRRHDREPLDKLTSREGEVLRGLAAGKTNAQIALSLFVAEGTIKSHVKHILRKLEVTNRTEAVAKYHRMCNSPLALSG